MTNDANPERQDYVGQLLDAYRRTPGTLGTIRPEDRRLAALLYERKIPLPIAEAALLLAAARRTFRPPDAPPLSPIRSLHYFLPVIDELLATPLADDYVRCLRRKLAQLAD